MYARLINNQINYAPKLFNTGKNLIVNFNKNTILLEKYGFKKVVDVKPEYDSSTHYLSIDGYVEDENTININYKLNEIVVNNEPTLEDRVKELEEVNAQQDEIINISLMATDELYMMLEPLLGEAISLDTKGVNKMVDMYVAMVQRGLKKIEDVPVRYREQVIEILKQLED